MDIFQSLDFEVLMPRHRGAYPEFRRQMVYLVRSGRTPEELAREFEPTVNLDMGEARRAGRWQESRRADQRRA